MSVLACPSCGRTAGAEAASRACECGDLYDVARRPACAPREPAAWHDLFARRRASTDELDRSGVWRFRELIDDPPPGAIVTLREGNTPLYASDALARNTGFDDVRVKHEGLNPTGSFKDRGMTVAVSRAAAAGSRTVVCASTGNTAASMAAFAARAGLRAVVLVPEGGTSPAKLVQAIAHGARAALVRGSFDEAMRLVREAAARGGATLLNSLNPFRVEGQKSIVLEVFEELGWEPPDWIVFPAGNLGNCAAFGRAATEALELGLIGRLPRLAAVQAAGAAPFARAFLGGLEELVPEPRPETVASAIRIGVPVSYRRAVRALTATRGVVLAVDDDAILDAKAAVDAAGIGAEPASCAAVAGARTLRGRGTIGPTESVVCVTTGHLLKDTGATLAYHEAATERANPPVTIDLTERALRTLLEGEP